MRGLLRTDASKLRLPRPDARGRAAALHAASRQRSVARAVGRTTPPT